MKTPITREMVSEPAVSGKSMEDGIAYIKIEDFPKGRSQEVAAKLKDLESDGAKKVILDLRNSGSGDENEGIATANLFLNHGMISYLQGQTYPKQTFNADPTESRCSQHSAGGAGESRNGWTGGASGCRNHGERSRRRNRRQDLRLGIDPEGH